MKKQNIVLKISLTTLGLFFVFNTYTYAEVIKSFDSQIVVGTENIINVTETIVYDSEGLTKHGIFRDIKPISSTGKTMDINDISVVDQNGSVYQWQKQNNNGDVRLKIGDPNVTFQGQKTYIIQYKASNAVAYVDSKLDEIYWNVTGNEWPFNIDRATAHVFLPEGAKILQESCYGGLEGMTLSCDTGNPEGVFSRSNLGVGGGMTVAVGFPTGLVHDHIPTIKEKIISLLAKFWPLLIPLLTSIIMFRRWYVKGRDPKDSSVIIPQYDVPGSLTPMEVGIIVYEKSRTKDISAELIYLATKGYIKIRQTNEKILGFINNKKYELIHLREQGSLVNDFDRKLLNKVFEGVDVGDTMDMSSLTRNFYKTIPSIFQSIRESVIVKQYYKYLPKINNTGNVVVLLVPIVWVIVILPLIISSISSLLLLFSIIVAIIIFVTFQKLMPAKTEKGVITKDYILGLKQYLLIAEKDRLNFHNAPEKKPEVFEQLLPYAMVLGVEKAWAKEFKDIYTTPPSWYEGSNGTFNAIFFTNSLSHFSTFASSTLSSSPHSSGSGSGGGGFSGGGGGGGGGGSW